MMFSTTLKATTFALVAMSLSSVCLSGDTPITSMGASWDKIKMETSPSEQTKGLDVPKTESSSSTDITTVKSVADPDRPENGTNDLNPMTPDDVIEKKESWTYTYTYWAIGGGVVTFLTSLGILYYTSCGPRLRTGIYHFNPFVKGWFL